jgi:flagellar M-ring protein FliF
MNEFFKRLADQVRGIYKKLSTQQKLIVAGVLVLTIAVFVIIIATASKPTRVVLYSELNVKDFGAITKKLQEYNYHFATKGNAIWVDSKDKEYIKMKLAQDSVIPQGIKGWELFDTEKWSTTDFERDINKRRAIIGEITKHIKMLDGIEECSIQITMPQNDLYIDTEKPITASVIITPSPFSDITKNPDRIKGIINLVAYGVDGLTKDKIVITDDKGNILSDFSSEGKFEFLDIAKKEFRIKEQLRNTMLSEVRRSLKNFIGEDKVDMNLDLELNFDQQQLEKQEYIPMVIKARDPKLPYDNSVVQDKVTRSKKNVNEKFKGHGFVPEGEGNVTPNLPPGYKEAANQTGEYSRDENIENYEIGEQKSKIQKAPYDIKRVSIAVWIDGDWDKLFRNGGIIFTNNKILRQYNPRSDEEMQKFQDIVRGSIGYDIARGDQVVVRNVKFNRDKEFAVEDMKELAKKRSQRVMLLALIGLLFIVLVTLLIRYLQKEGERSRRFKEEELARQQELLRQQALAEAEKGDMEQTMSLEEKARLEMEENARNLAKDHPDNVAALLRTWMAESS